MRFVRTNLVAEQIGGEILAPMYYERARDSAVFEVWFEGRLMPLLKPRTLIIMDNAPFHRKEELRKIALSHNVMILFLPPYSPECNSIEKLWANIKRCLRKKYALL